ncbi:MAG TPA: GntR family transcriptional regulator, partial [Desulfosarcina sp.]|nr:GntR family transcriptional regulator [Desulfosarcina sp.]
SFFESARQKGIQASGEVLKAEIVPAKLKVAKGLALQESEPVIRIVTLRRANGEPVTVHDAYVPYKLFPNLMELDLGSKHLWELIETFGFRVKRADQRLEAREADEWLAELLNIDVGAPILFKERTVYADDGTPVEYTFCYNRGDRYSLTVTLYR